MGDLRIFFVISLFAIGGALITWFLSFFKKKLVTFMPSIVSFILLSFSILKMYFNNDSTGWAELGYFAAALLFASAFLGSLITAIIINKKITK